MQTRVRRTAWAAVALAALVVAGCGPDAGGPDSGGPDSGGPADEATADVGGSPDRSAAASCADLSFRGGLYNEWREFHPTGILQEVGNATYPACNATQDGDGVDADGYRATDVWLLEGADVADAVVGLREGTHTHVIFVRVGVDPTTAVVVR